MATKKMIKTVPVPPKKEVKIARFCIIDGTYVCAEDDFCGSEWDEGTFIQWFEFETPVENLKGNNRKYTTLKVA